MNKKLIILFIVLVLTMSDFPGLDAASVHFNIRPLKSGVWAVIHNDKTGHAIGNAGIVDLGDETLVFDTFMNLDAADALKRMAMQLTHHPVRYVVNSHHHNDHIRGNQLFDQATIISTAANREAIRKSEPDELRWEVENAPKILQGYRKQYSSSSPEEKKEIILWLNYFEGMVMNSHKVRTRLPELVFSDSMEIHGKKRLVSLHEYHGGHSASDVVMLLPKDSIVFTGDLLFTERHPYLADGDPSKVVIALEVLLKKEAKQFVPGHGEPCGQDGVKQMVSYIHDMQSMVKQAKSSSLPDSLVMQLPVPKPYAQWPFKRFYQANLDHFNKH